MMKNKVLDYVMKNKMIEDQDTVVVGVSGGADSMCLLHILCQLKESIDFSLLVVHINHGIRGENARRDASFVEEYCNKNGIDVYVKEYDVPMLSKKWGMSVEEAGRKVRYDGFRQALMEYNGTSKGKIAVAHNGDDVAETVLFNLFRGSSIKGLTGIPPVRDDIIRPLLCLKRSEIEQYNEEHNIKYVTDETNLTTDYTRNKLRLSIIPQVTEGINERAVEHINETAKSMLLINDYMDMMAKDAFKNVAKEEETGIYINTDDFMKLHEAIKWELVKMCIYKVSGKVKDISRIHMETVMGLFNLSVGKSLNLPYEIIAKKQYDGVFIGKNTLLENMDCDRETCLCKNPRLEVSKGEWSFGVFQENQYTKLIDCDIMENDLQLRTRMSGDYIVVDAKGSKKKLKDYFIDKKIPKEERDNILLVANGNDIVWVVGYRLSEAYKVKDTSRNICQLKIVMEDT